MEKAYWIGGLAALLALLVTPPVRRAAVRWNLVDSPDRDARRVHSRPVPQGGGLAIFVAFWGAVVLGGLWEPELWGWLAASAVILGVGLLDDRYTLSPAWKLAGQVGAAGILVATGTRIEFLSNPFGDMLYLGVWGIPLTILWLVTVINVVNFIDGLDGLAAGVTGIAAGPLAVLAFHTGQPTAGLLAMVLAGAAIGFLPHNFNPARIFMGDSGSLFLGLILGAVAVDGAFKGATAITLGVAVLALGLPLFDAAFAIVRRFASGRPVYEGDRGHVHHRLLDLGLSHRQAVLVLYGLSVLFSGGALLLLGLQGVPAALIFGGVTGGAVLLGKELGLVRGKTAQTGSRRQL